MDNQDKKFSVEEKKKRKSGLRSKYGDPFDFDLSDLSEFISPYFDFRQEYRDLKKILKKEKIRGYYVRYKNAPDLFYIAFVPNRYKAKGEATMYYRDTMHPLFMGKDWLKEHLQARARLAPELDKYWKVRRVPLKVQMELGGLFRCAYCGKGLFSYKDLEAKKCYVVFGEGNLNPYTDGICLCADCVRATEPQEN